MGRIAASPRPSATLLPQQQAEKGLTREAVLTRPLASRRWRGVAEGRGEAPSVMTTSLLIIVVGLVWKARCKGLQLWVRGEARPMSD